MKKSIKKFSSASLILILLFCFTACKSEPNIQQNEFETSRTNLYESRTEETNENLTDIAEVGFENPNSWGNSIIEIQSTTTGNVIFSDDTGTFVIASNRARCFEFYPSQGQMLWGFMNTDFAMNDTEFATYTVLNNDTISVFSPDEGNGILKIIDRKEEKNTTIFEIDNNGGRSSEYYIPQKSLDTSITPALFQEGDYYDYYKYYIK